MKKIIWIIIILFIIGVGYWLISPLFTSKKVHEGIEEIMPTSQKAVEAPIAMTTLSVGTFTGAAGHSASGTAKIIQIGDKKYVRLEEDFSVTNGPDLFVHLGKDGEYDPLARLGTLKGNIGSQNYEIPSDVDLSKYNEIWVWCRSFSVPFAKAFMR